MATFAELMTQIVHSAYVKTRLEIAGEWEALQTDFPESNWHALWSHSLDEDFADCVLGLEFDDKYLMNIVISRPKFCWHGHELRVGKGREYQRIVVTAREPEAVVLEACNAVMDGISQTRRGWKRCKHCGGRQPCAYMHEAGVCMGCASSVLGVVY
jgi:hypothetical protein